MLIYKCCLSINITEDCLMMIRLPDNKVTSYLIIPKCFVHAHSTKSERKKPFDCKDLALYMFYKTFLRN